MSKLRICHPDLLIKLLTFTEEKSRTWSFLEVNFVYFVYAHYNVIKIYKLAVWMKTFVDKEIKVVV